LLDLKGYPEEKMQVETTLRGEIERLVEVYKNRIDEVFDATWKMLSATKTFIRV
jgi:hypothetical protein